MASERLSGLDASFLHLEQGGAHMHVASTLVFRGEAPPYESFRDHVLSRLHLVPRFRQRLRFIPFGSGRPVWSDDPHFNISYHVRHTALPPPGGDEQLRTLAARIFSQRLDRSKPLWELWLVDRLEGDRFAIIGKSHHCLVDGVSGVDITTVLFDAAAEAAPVPGPDRPWIPSPEPSDAELLARTLAEQVGHPSELVRSVGSAITAPLRAISRLREGASAAGSMLGTGLGAPSSPLNVPIGPHRRFAWVQADLADFKRIKQALGATVNDVVLGVVAGALGRFLRGRGQSTVELELRAMVPISVRADGEHGALGNRVSAIMAPLPVWCEDPIERVTLMSRVMGDLKRSKQAVGAELLTGLTDFAPPTIAGQAARLQSRQRFFNLVITNVPGPQFPLYLLGRELDAAYPMVPLAENQAVCVGIMSYNGQLNFGLIGDYDAMPGLDALADDVRASISELLDALPSGSGPVERLPVREPDHPVGETQAQQEA